MTETTTAVHNLTVGDRVILEDGRGATITKVSSFAHIVACSSGETMEVEWVTDDGADGSATVSDQDEVKTEATQ